MNRDLRGRRALAALAIAVAAGVLALGGAAQAAPDSKGTDYWLMFTQNLTQTIPPAPPTLSLFVTSDVATTGTVEIAGQPPTPFDVTAGAVATVAIPLAAEVTSVDTVEAKGVHVTAQAEVTVYGLSQAPTTTDAFLGLPTDVLGDEYLVLGYRNTLAQAPLGSQFGVVAAEDDTTVTITPTVTTLGHAAGEAYTVPLDAGETYQLRTTAQGGDLSGTVITSTNPVAVFGGHHCANVPPDRIACNHLVEQLPSTDNWGDSFVTMPLATRTGGDTFRFLSATDGTVVTVNGTDLPALNRGQVREQVIDGAAVIEATAPILVAQYSNSSSFDNLLSQADPSMTLVPPTEQFLTGYTVTTPATGFPMNFVNVVAPAAAVGSITLDGNPILGASFTPIGASGFSGAQVAVDVGSHRLQGPLAFGVSAYGFATLDSYGYPGGVSFEPVPVVAAVSLTPDDATNTVGERHCVMATVTDQNSAPFVGASVSFTVTGDNPTTGSGTSGANGQVEFCYVGMNAGTDTITATAAGFTDTASKTWEPEPPEATTLTLTPADATNIVGEEHCVTAAVTDQNGDPFAGASVSFSVTGVNTASGTETTGVNGEAEFCYTGTNAGDDMITATLGQLTDTATKTWEPLRPAALSLTPPTGTNTVGVEHCVTAEVDDQLGDPFVGGSVAFTVAGAHTISVSVTTDVAGQARLCYTGENTGNDTITASIAQLTATASKTWDPAPPVATVLSLTPETATNTVGEPHCVVAAVDDQRGEPFVGGVVGFAVTGANPTSGTDTTDQDGEADFCYTGANAGPDVITATLGPLTDTASKIWTPAVEEPGAVLLVLDEETFGKKSKGLTPGQALTVATGQTGDEGWFAPTCIPRKWLLGGSGDACLEGEDRQTAIDNFVGTNGPAAKPKQSRLDKIPAVMPLRALGLRSLIEQTVCAVAYDSDVSLNYDRSTFPFTSANLQGKTKGLVAFRVDALASGKKSSSTLPQVTVTILDAEEACGDWQLFNAPVPSSSSEPSDTRPDRPPTIGEKGYRQLKTQPAKELFF